MRTSCAERFTTFGDRRPEQCDGRYDLLAAPARPGARGDGDARSSVRITVERAMPEETVVFLCVIGSYPAISELPSMVDGSAAVGGIIAADAG